MIINNRVMKKMLYVFAAAFIICTSESVVAGAESSEPFLGEQQTDTETNQTAAGWQQINGRKYYFLPGTGQMATGWQEIDGESYYFQLGTGELITGRQQMEDGVYYFSPETGAMLTGWQEVNGEKRYFSPESGRMATGWQKIDGERFYISKNSGEIVTGLQKIGQDSYFFDSEGVLLTEEWITNGSKKYYSGKSGALLSDWQEIENGTYYFSPENNCMVTGSQEIDGEYYIFNSKGRLAKSKGTSLVTVGKKFYCADKSGKAVSGWQIIGKKLYYASKSGKVKTNTTYQGITFGSKGAAKDNQNARLKIKVMQTFASITNDRMSKSEKLRACWSYVVGGEFRYAVKYPNLNTSGWQRKTAYDMLSTHSGNCYSFACVFAALAEEAGYKPYVVCGRVRGTRDHSSDGYTRHAWVRINGRNYDPEAQYAGWRRGVYGNSSYPVSNVVQSVIAY